MKKPLTESPRYTQFIHERDLGLEKVLRKYQITLSYIVDTLKTHSKQVAAYISTENHGLHFMKKNRELFQQRLEIFFQMATEQTLFLMTQLRRTIYVLSYLGQAEGMGRALGKPQRVELSNQKLAEHLKQDSPSGGDLHARIQLAYHRLLRDVVDAFQLSQVQGSSPKETLERIDRSFPKGRRIPKSISIAKLREADRKKKDEQEEIEFTFGTASQAEIDQAIEDYRSEYLPVGRGPYDKVFYPSQNDLFSTDDTVEGYQWELENEVTNDFIDSVRNGEIDVANENGITDFVWIAVVDQRTDECCLTRDGLTTREIESKLKQGVDMGDCEETNPPAHLNCRCRIAPITDDMPEVPPPDFGSFDEYLAKRAREGGSG